MEPKQLIELFYPDELNFRNRLRHLLEVLSLNSVFTRTLLLCCSLLLGAMLPVAGSVAKEQKTIRIAVGEWPPFLDPLAPDKGCMGKLFQDVFKQHNIKVKLLFMHWLAAYARTEKGIFNATAYWFDKPERRQSFVFSDQHITLENSYFFYNKSAPVEFYDWHDLSGKTIIINKGFGYTEEFFENLKNFDIRTYTINDEKLNFKMLYLKRGDLTILSEKTSQEFLKRMPKNISQQIARHTFPPLVNKGYMLFAPSLPETALFKQAFDKGFATLMANKEYRQWYTSQCASI